MSQQLYVEQESIHISCIAVINTILLYHEYEPDTLRVKFLTLLLLLLFVWVAAAAVLVTVTVWVAAAAA